MSSCVCVCVFLVGHWSVRYAELKQATHAQSNNRQTKNECIMKWRKSVSESEGEAMAMAMASEVEGGGEQVSMSLT